MIHILPGWLWVPSCGTSLPTPPLTVMPGPGLDGACPTPENHVKPLMHSSSIFPELTCIKGVFDGDLKVSAVFGNKFTDPHVGPGRDISRRICRNLRLTNEKSIEVVNATIV